MYLLFCVYSLFNNGLNFLYSQIYIMRMAYNAFDKRICSKLDHSSNNISVRSLHYLNNYYYE